MQRWRQRMTAFGLAATAIVGMSAPAFANEGDKERHAEKMRRFDRNSDGKLDDRERTEMKTTLSTEMFRKFDTNSDGSLSMSEFQAGWSQKLEEKYKEKEK